MEIGEAFLLLSLPRATLESQNETPVTDSLYLECVTLPAAQSPFPDRDICLVIKLGYFEIPVHPSRRVVASIRHHSHLYTFLPTDPDPEFSISVPFPHSPVASQDLETFNHVLTQYVSSFSEQRDRKHIPYHLDQKIDTPPPPARSVNEQEYEDLRGRLVLMDESDGTVLGELDHDFKINEDLSRDLPDGAPVVIDLPPDYDSATAVRANVPGQEFTPLTAREAFVRAVPPEERDALMNTATLIR
jgi:spartin